MALLVMSNGLYALFDLSQWCYSLKELQVEWHVLVTHCKTKAWL